MYTFINAVVVHVHALNQIMCRNQNCRLGMLIAWVKMQSMFATRDYSEDV
jgi:hypothetical protein